MAVPEVVPIPVLGYEFGCLEVDISSTSRVNSSGARVRRAKTLYSDHRQILVSTFESSDFLLRYLSMNFSSRVPQYYRHGSFRVRLTFDSLSRFPLLCSRLTEAFKFQDLNFIWMFRDLSVPQNQ